MHETPEFLREYDAFLQSHPLGGFMQTLEWAALKKHSGWDHELVLSRAQDGAINGSMMILVRKTPMVPSALLYAPRGPVCDIHDRAVMETLLSGAQSVVKKYGACALKIDPYVHAGDQAAIDAIKSHGFEFTPGAPDLTSAQTRNNYMLDIRGKTEDEVLMGFSQKTRYNIRVAVKHGVECRPCGVEYLDEFYRLMQITGKRDDFEVRPKSYFAQMLEHLPFCRMYLCFFEGKVVSGAITTQYAGKTCYVYGASDNEYRNHMPNYLMQWEMIKWAIESGGYLYDFQGIPFYQDETSPFFGIYRFKRGFGGEVVEFAGDFDKIYNRVIDSTIKFALQSKRRISGALRRH